MSGNHKSELKKCKQPALKFNTMHPSQNTIGIAFILVLLLVIWGCSKPKVAPREALKYTCPMHPEIEEEKMGICPICKMDLEQVHQPKDTLQALNEGIKSVDLKQIKTIYAKDTAIADEENVNGLITYNSNSFRQVSARVGGRIEKLYVRYNFQPVVKGQKLMEIYSPEIASAAQELLFLKKEGETDLLEAAKKKLYLLGINQAQVSSMLKTGKVDYSVAIYSPYSGFISDTRGLESTGPSIGSKISPDRGSPMNSMGSGAATATSTEPPRANAAGQSLLLREGQYVAIGQKMFSIVSAEDVWAEFYVDPSRAKALKAGSRVKIEQGGEKGLTISAPVNRIQPFYKEGTNYVQVRALVPNSRKMWRVGEQVQVKYNAATTSGKWLPNTAVLSLGSKNVVFEKKEGVFAPVYVDVKGKANGYVNVGNSLRADVEVAENGWFIVDSESFIKPKGGHGNDQ